VLGRKCFTERKSIYVGGLALVEDSVSLRLAARLLGRENPQITRACIKIEHEGLAINIDRAKIIDIGVRQGLQLQFHLKCPRPSLGALVLHISEVFVSCH
jgi:hypothetical protein